MSSVLNEKVLYNGGAVSWNVSIFHQVTHRRPLYVRMFHVYWVRFAVFCAVCLAGIGALSLSATLTTHVCLVSSLRRNGGVPPQEVQNSHWASSATLLAIFFDPYSEICC